MIWIIAFALIMLALSVVLVVLGARTPQFAIDKQAIHVTNSLFGRDIPLAELDRQSARVVDLAKETELAPVIRTYGFGLGAKRSGWFRLRNGETALVYLTRSQDLIYIKSRKGYSILVSPVSSDSFMSLILASGS